MEVTMRLGRLAALASFLLAASTATQAEELPKYFGDAKPKSGGSVVYGIESEIPSLDPHVTFGGSNKRVVFSIFEGLLKRDRANIDFAGTFAPPKIVPALTESWEELDGGKRYRFHLRKGIKFHDGTDFNADAVVFNFRRIIDPKFEFYYERANALKNGPLKFVTSVEKVDDSTVDFNLERPWSVFLSQMSGWLAPGLPLMMSPESIKKYGNEGVNAHPAGTGPFKVTEIEPGVSVTTERNAEYWNGPQPYLDKITYVVMAEQSARVFALEGGEADIITQLSPDNIKRLKDEGFTVVESPISNQMWYMAVNVSEPPFSDVRVRQAVNYAIDRKAITDQLLQGICIPSDNIVFPTSPLYKTTQRYPYDPEKAKALLKEAGYPDGFTTKIRVPTSGSSMLVPVPMAEWIQRDLAKVGIKLEIVSNDWVTYLGFWLKGLEKGEGFNVMSWASDYDEFWAIDLFGKGGFGNGGHVVSPAIDEHYVEFQSAMTEDKQNAIATKIFDEIHEQAYTVPICSEKINVLTSKRLKGVLPLTDPGHLTQFWWVEE
jgi:peptide/nickel transport system substrate-binding protein